MTAADWDTAELPTRMLCGYPAAWNRRKVRLFWAACLRRAMRTRVLVALVENDPDGTNPLLLAEVEATRQRLVAAGDPLTNPDYWELGVFLDAPPAPLLALLSRAAVLSAEYAAWRSGFSPREGSWFRFRNDAEAAETARQCALIREVFGNPFRPIDFAPWRTDTAVALALDMYENREFGAMPILGDALQDAGCEDEYVLNHCREDREHVRGCWVLDALLGK